MKNCDHLRAMWCAYGENVLWRVASASLAVGISNEYMKTETVFQEGKEAKECLILRTVHVDFLGVMTLGGWMDTLSQLLVRVQNMVCSGWLTIFCCKASILITTLLCTKCSSLHLYFSMNLQYLAASAWRVTVPLLGRCDSVSYWLLGLVTGEYVTDVCDTKVWF